jgi:soluble lytic murein transglycosylase-like protein
MRRDDIPLAFALAAAVGALTPSAESRAQRRGGRHGVPGEARVYGDSGQGAAAARRRRQMAAGKLAATGVLEGSTVRPVD